MMNRKQLLKLACLTLASLLACTSPAQDASGEIMLAAKDAKLAGGSARYDLSQNVIRDWRHAETVATWNFDLDAKKTFRVKLVYSCIPSSAGTEASIQIAGQRIVHLITSTGDWNSFREINVGPIILRNAGKQTLTIQLPEKKALHGAWNLRGIRLVPEN